MVAKIACWRKWNGWPAYFKKWSKTERAWVDCAPPKMLINSILNLRHSRFPSIVGVITTPTMRDDGSIITAKGYDEYTKRWLEPLPSGEIQLGHIGTTKAEAVTALQLIKELFVEFPFADGDKDKSVDRSVALSIFMTAVLRTAFKVAPLFLIHKPEAGTGASYLVKMAAVQALGYEAPPLKTSNTVSTSE
jgi:putative DNA primase/helicase